MDCHIGGSPHRAEAQFRGIGPVHIEIPFTFHFHFLSRNQNQVRRTRMFAAPGPVVWHARAVAKCSVGASYTVIGWFNAILGNSKEKLKQTFVIGPSGPISTHRVSLLNLVSYM